MDLTSAISVVLLSAVLITLQDLLQWATANNFFPRDDDTGALIQPAAVGDRVALGGSVTQQIWEAGLPQQMIKLMKYVTQQLPASQEAFAAAVNEISNSKSTGCGLLWASSSNLFFDGDRDRRSSTSSIDLAGLLTMSSSLLLAHQRVVEGRHVCHHLPLMFQWVWAWQLPL